MNVRQARLALGLLVVAGLGLAACERPRSVTLPEGAGLWVAPGSFTSSEEAASQLGRFPRALVGYLLLDLGAVEWRQGRMEFDAAWPQGWSPDRPVVLALRLTGESPADATALRRELAEMGAGLAAAAERRGITVLGIHLQLEGRDPGRWTAALVDLRHDLPAEWSLGVGSLDPRLDVEAWARLAEVADLVVPTVYGQDPSLADVPAAWDLRRIEESVQRLAVLERPFMAAIVTIGGVTVTGPQGESPRVSTTTPLVELGRTPGLRPDPGFAWEGVDRQVHTFRATAPVHLTGLGLIERGSRLRGVQTTDAHVSELLRRLGAWSPPGFRGVVFYRLALPGERTALGAEELARALALRPWKARFGLSLERSGGTQPAPVLRVLLSGLDGGRTDLAFHEGNVLELRSVDGGYFSGIQAGDFDRFAQLRVGPDGQFVPELRRPDIVRFYFTALEEGETLAAGPLRWHPTTPRSRVLVRGQVVLPIGTVQRLPAAEFPEPER